MVDYNNKQYIPDSKSKASTAASQSSLLTGINTEGLSKTQKKKLKKKIKKGIEQQNKDELSKKDEEEEDDEDTKDSQQVLTKGQERAKATADQLMQMNENEDDLKFQRPRSHSLPNMQFVEMDD